MKVATIIAVIGVAVAAPAVSAQDAAVTVKEEKAGLLAQATLKPDSAQRLALAKVPGKVTEVEIEEEDGRLVYEVTIAGDAGSKEVHIDAKTGEFVPDDDDNGMGAGMNEGDKTLLAEAAIQPDSAEALVRTAEPGATIVKREISRSGDRLFYTFEVTVQGKEGVKKVKVDAKTGEVVKPAGE